MDAKAAHAEQDSFNLSILAQVTPSGERVTLRASTDKVRKLKADAFLKQAQGLSSSLAGDCERPVAVTLSPWDHIATTLDREKVKRWNPDVKAHQTFVRCRGCPACRRHRQNKWAARACAEQLLAERTWFLTMTFGPEHRLKLEAYAERKVRIAGYTLRDAEGFDPHPDPQRVLASFARSEVQKFWKRLRKSLPRARLRYLGALEHHKDGWPHVHALLHTAEGSVPDGFVDGFPAANALFAKIWNLGFCQTWPVDRIDPQRAFYVAKYLSKSGGRISASLRYGRPPTGGPTSAEETEARERK